MVVGDYPESRLYLVDKETAWTSVEAKQMPYANRLHTANIWGTTLLYFGGTGVYV